MASDKKQKERLKALRKREKTPRPKPVVTKPVEMKSGERQKFTDRNSMVLLAIERTIVATSDKETAIDDEIIGSALKNAITKRLAMPDQSDADDVAATLQKDLIDRYQSMFAANDSTAADVWIDGLRAIYTSVMSVSQCQSGETNYLQKARSFVAQMGR